MSSGGDGDLLEELRGLYLLAGLSEELLRGVAGSATVVRFADGDVLFREGEASNFWYVLLEGRIEIWRAASRREAFIVAAMAKPGDWFGGIDAWAPVSQVGTGRAVGSGRVLRAPSRVLYETVLRDSQLAFHLIAGFYSTGRDFEAQSRAWNSLVSLGELSAGLAHELNNPASAATRSVDALRSANGALLSSLVQMASASLTAEQFLALDSLRGELEPLPSTTEPVVVARHEEQIAGWLESRGVDHAWELAPSLAASGADIAWLDQAHRALAGATLGPALQWVASWMSTQTLLDEVKEATKRISMLVDAVKPYSQVGRASAQLIDVTEGLESTLVILAERLRTGVDVVRDYAADLPRIEAYPGELNQVWTNLIANAIDAMAGVGTLTLTAHVDGGMVVVTVGDTGSGMTADVQSHAFDTFFTTKDVGKGTGLGLDIARRLVVERHNGSIEIESAPGRTVITVRLPRTRVAPGQLESTELVDAG